MRKIKYSPTWKSRWSRTATALLFLTLGNSFPLSAAETAHLSAVEPTVPPPQGILTVYSERYVIEDEGTPIPHRRPVEVFTEQGRFVTSQCDTDDNPGRFDLLPGHYIVASTPVGAEVPCPSCARVKGQNPRLGVIKQLTTAILRECGVGSHSSSRHETCCGGDEWRQALARGPCVPSGKLSHQANSALQALPSCASS
jgi:hypothetical protein